MVESTLPQARLHGGGTEAPDREPAVPKPPVWAADPASLKAVEEQARQIKDEVARLRFLRSQVRAIPEMLPPTAPPVPASVGAAAAAVESAVTTPGAYNRRAVGQKLSPPPVRSNSVSRFTFALAVALTVVLVGGGVFLHQSIQAGNLPAERIPIKALGHEENNLGKNSKVPSGAADQVPKVWLVERTRQSEFYSNGLRVEIAGSENHTPRRFPVFDAAGDHGVIRWGHQPVGIVFHGTESDPAPFEPENAPRIRRQGKGLLDYVRSQKAYHYVVDRIGRVHQTVNPETKADHAGNSVWVSQNEVYLQLNQSFLGVAFEAQTKGELEEPALTPAQIHSGRILVDMLRSRYKLPAENCVAHAQVSVNPKVFMHGFHSDWVRDLPWKSLGLPDNYGQGLASLNLFGFAYETSFASAASPALQAVLSQTPEARAEPSGRLVLTASMRKGRSLYKKLLETQDRELRRGNRNANERNEN